MFIPNVRCTITTNSGFDQYGARVAGPSVESMCGIVKLEVGTQRTSVRADSSASRGHNEEAIVDARLLFSAGTDIQSGYKVRVHGFDLKVLSVFPRYSVNGDFDHWQVDLKNWASQ